MAKFWETGDSITAADLNRTGGYGEVVLPTMTLSEINTILGEVEAEGGGTVVFKNGVYTFAGDLILPDRTGIIGESYGGCVIMFSGAYGIKASGTLKYNVGTITVARNSSTVTGQGTSFLTNVDIGDEVFILATYATVTAVVSDTELTIQSNHVLDPVTESDYHVAIPKESINVSSLIIIGDGTGECLQMNYAKNCFLDKIIVSGGLVGLDMYGVSTVGANDIVGQSNVTTFKAGMSGLISANGLSSLDAITHFDLDDLVACIYTNVAAFNGTNGIVADGVRQSIIQSSGIGYFTESGIDVNDCYELDIKGTYIHDCGTGIDIDSNSLRTKVANCTIQTNTTDITDAGTDTLISGNIGVSDKNTSPRCIVETFDTTGESTWTKPEGAVSVLVKAWGGGGGAGGSNDASSERRASGGSGAGYAEALFNADDLTESVTVTVGAGGSGGTSGSGSDGGASTFGSYLTAYQGRGGMRASDATGNQAYAPGGAGPMGVGGKSTSSTGGAGSPGSPVAGRGNDGDGGQNGLYGSGAGNHTNNGGNAYYGGAGGGGIDQTTTRSGGTSFFGGNGGNSKSGSAGDAGGVRGGGGGGSYLDTGGAGGRGEVIVITYL